MSVSLYEVTVTPFIRSLTSMSKFLKKGQDFAKENGKEDSQLLEARLFPDMKDLIYQVQRVSDTAKGLAVRVGEIEPVSLPDEEKTFEDLYQRIQKTIDVLNSVDKAKFDADPNKPVKLKAGPTEIDFIAINYATMFAIPNFYFHVTTTYALLRANGVPVGKSDFLGRT